MPNIDNKSKVQAPLVPHLFAPDVEEDDGSGLLRSFAGWMGDLDPRIRYLGMRGIVDSGVSDPVGTLRLGLMDEDASVRVSTVLDLELLVSAGGILGDAAKGALIYAYGDESPWVRAHVLDAIDISWGDSGPYLLKTALADEEGFVRERAIGRLSALGEEVSIPWLGTLLKDGRGDYYQKFHAVNRLVVLAGQESEDAAKELQEAFSKFLKEIRDPSSLVRRLEAGKGLLELLWAVGRNPRLEAALTEALKDASPDVRRVAAIGLSIIEHPSAIGILRRELTSKDDESRFGAFAALTRYDPGAHPQVQRMLEEALAREPDGPIRQVMAGSMRIRDVRRELYETKTVDDLAYVAYDLQSIFGGCPPEYALDLADEFLRPKPQETAPDRFYRDSFLPYAERLVPTDYQAQLVRNMFEARKSRIRGPILEGFR